MQIMGEHFPQGEMSIVSCKQCGFVYNDMAAVQEDFNRYYSSPNSQSLSYYEAYGKESTEKYFNDILNNIQKHISLDSQIVDIGGGLGDFACFLMLHGYQNVYVLDISTKCINEAHKRGIKGILSDTFTFDQSLSEKFDLAIFGHSLEHYLDIDRAIASTKQMLKADGHLYIELPDAQKYCDEKAVAYTMFTYEHLCHFTLNTMDNIANAFGLSLLDKGRFLKADSYHVLYGLYKNGNYIKDVKFDNTAENAIRKYAEHSKKQLDAAISDLEMSKEKLILWGIGASTALLLNHTFDRCNVISLIDRNPARQGIEYQIGDRILTIQDPETIKDDDATIVVLPFWYKDSIMAQIKDMGFKNKVVALSKN